MRFLSKKEVGILRKVVVGFIVFCLYGYPYVYYSMYQDFTDRLLFNYLIMIVATSTFAFIGKLYSNYIPIILGNIVSAIISFYFILKWENNAQYEEMAQWGSYFVPFSPNELLVFVSVLNLIPQLFTMNLAKKMKNRVRG